MSSLEESSSKWAGRSRRGAGWVCGRPEAGPAPRPHVQLRSVNAAPCRVIKLRSRGARSFLSQSELALVRLFVLGGWFFFLNSVSSVSSLQHPLWSPALSPPPGAFCALANHFSLLFPRFCSGVIPRGVDLSLSLCFSLLYFIPSLPLAKIDLINSHPFNLPPLVCVSPSYPYLLPPS